MRGGAPALPRPTLPSTSRFCCMWLRPAQRGAAAFCVEAPDARVGLVAAHAPAQGMKEKMRDLAKTLGIPNPGQLNM
jgi:hypothetical protein